MLTLTYPSLHISFTIPCTQQEEQGVWDKIKKDFESHRDSVVRMENGVVKIYAWQWNGCEAVLEIT